MWSSVTGKEQTVEGDFTYLTKQDKNPAIPPATEAPKPTKEAYKITAINQVTVIVNRLCKVEVDTTKTVGSLTGTVTTVAELPENPSTNDVYYITNGTSTLDNYYVRWQGGAWVETVRPGIDVGLDDSTMPHALVQTATGFAFGEVPYTDRVVGNGVTNEQPSFVGTYIENSFFYLNRVGFLSTNNVVLSQPLKPNPDPYKIQPVNFYRISTLTQSAADPVDLNASSIRPVILRSVQPTYQGIILFADGEQFIMYSEQGVITPQTAIIKSIATYEMYGDVNAIELGDEYYFLSRTLRHTRVFKMVPRGIQEGPEMTEVTRIISDFIPNNIDNLVPNSQNGFISLSNANEPFMYIYRTFIDNGEIQFRSWYTWELVGDIKTCIFVKDRMYAITSQGGRYAVSSVTLNTIPEEDILTNITQQSGFASFLASIGPYLDLWVGQKRFKSITYTTEVTNSDGDVIVTDPIIELPDNYPAKLTGKKPCAIETKDELNRSGLTETGTGAVFPVEEDNGKWVIKGTFKKNEIPFFVLGYRYDYDLYLPDYYLQTDSGSDYTAYLNISRYKFSFKEASEVQFLIKSWGRNKMEETSDDWTQVIPTPTPRYYYLDKLPVDREVEIVVPIHQRNTNFIMRIFSDSPFPVTLNKLMWEGNYNARYYRRI